MKKMKQVVAIFLSAGLLLGSVLPAFAADAPTAKEEVIYVMMDSAGQIRNVNAVNIYGQGQVTDYGTYTNLKTLNADVTVNYVDGVITFDNTEERTYVQGTMENVSIPWNVSLRYYLDGQELSAQEVAGKSGHLELHFDITQNTEADSFFYEQYALQAIFTLDTVICRNISAPDATLANVGSDKQLTYTILPGRGISTVISADVTNFVMDEVSINGVKLSLNIEIDDQELLDKVSELMSAVSQLDDGTKQLSDGTIQLQEGASTDLKDGVTALTDGVSELLEGAESLKDGASSLNGGALTLSQGTDQLYDGVASLKSGIEQVEAGLKSLNSNSSTLTGGSAQVLTALKTIQNSLTEVSAEVDQLDLLVVGSSLVSAGIDKLADATVQLQSNVSFAAYKSTLKEYGLDIDYLKKSNNEAIDTIDTLVSNIRSGLDNFNQFWGFSTPLDTLLDKVAQISLLLKGNNAMISATQTYLDTVNNNLVELADGVDDLKTSYVQIHSGICAVVEEVYKTLDSMEELKEGIDTLVSEYCKLDSGLKEYTDGVAQLAAGYNKVVDGAAELLTGSKNLQNGASELYDGTGELLKGMTEFYSGGGALNDGVDKLSDGVDTLLEGISAISEGASQLSDGTGEFRSETDSLDTDVTSEIDSMISSITGADGEVKSFTDSRNTEVQSVQFVLKADAVEESEEAEAQDEPAAKLTFWQKLLKLFGLYKG